MSEFATTLSDLVTLCGTSEYQLAQVSGPDPTFVRRLVDGEKRASHLNIIRLTLALVMHPELARQHPATVPYMLNALTAAHLGDALAELDESRGRPAGRLGPGLRTEKTERQTT